MNVNLLSQLGAAWAAMLIGAIWGAALGLFFHHAEWLGGYGSWRRRLLRLGHIACFGMGLLNLAYVGTLSLLPPPLPPGITRAGALLWLLALVSMPLICALAAWRKGFRQLFLIPVGASFAAIAVTLHLILMS